MMPADPKSPTVSLEEKEFRNVLNELVGESHDRREQLLQSILNTAVDAIIVMDQRGIIRLVNRHTEIMFGYSMQELVGQNVNILMPQPYRDGHDGYIARYLKTREPHIIGIGREVIALRKDGTAFPVDLAVSEIDHLGYFTGMIRDVTERKHLQRHVLEVVTEEQNRIAQELHDGLGQELTGLSMYCSALLKSLDSLPAKQGEAESDRVLDSGTFETVRGIAERLAQGLADSMRNAKKLAHGILPVQLDTEGLQVALQKLADLTNALPEIDCHFACGEPVAFNDNSTATHLYRIAQEALSNALRHGYATRIDIHLVSEDRQIILEIRDNGTGFDHAGPYLPKAADCSGMGLRTMEYRAGLMGGRLQITRLPEKGTLVRCIIPLPPVER
ncbi:MAG: PAS domain S-box protein [Planctomycetales bacterium]